MDAAKTIEKVVAGGGEKGDVNVSRNGLPFTMLNEILNGKRTVTTDFALLMEAALGVSSDLLLRMQVSYNIQTAMQDKTLSQRLAEVRRICAVM